MRFLFCFLLLCFLPACRMIESDDYDVNRRALPSGSPELKKIGDRILYAVQHSDYKEFEKYVNSDENKISEEDFHSSGKNIRDQFGRITGYEYLTDLQLPLMHNMIWKVHFERKGKNQETVRQDLLFRLILGTIDGKTHVISMGFL